MLHGQIVHGRQHLAADKLDLPTTYYSADGGAGKAHRRSRPAAARCASA